MRWLPVALVLASGCGVTFGVDAIEQVTEVEADADGAAAFAIRGIEVDDDVAVCGGATAIEARVETAQWANDGEAAEPIDASLVRDGDRIELRLAGGGETVTLQRIGVDVPESLATDIDVGDSPLAMCDLAAPVLARARTVELTDIAAPAEVRADSVRVHNTVPLELTATGSVTGTFAADATITAGGSVTVSLTEVAVGGVDIHSDGPSEDFVSLHVPPGGAWTITIQSDRGVGLIEVGDALYDSNDPDALPLSDGVTVDVNGGGPEIIVTSVDAGVFVRESAE